MLILAWHSMRNARWQERCSAAADAGFDAVGLNPRAWPALDPGTDASWLRSVAEDHGLRLAEVEVARIGPLEASLPTLDLAASVGALHVQTVAPFEKGIDLGRAADELAALGAAAAERGIRLCLEFLPFTDVPDVATSRRLLDAAGNPPAVGLCVDSWHVFRGAGLDSLDGLDPALVVTIQLDDGTLVPEHPDYLYDCLHHRRLPGDGEFDLAGFFARLPPATGPDATPVSVEVIDDDLDALPPADAARRLAAATRAAIG